MKLRFFFFLLIPFFMNAQDLKKDQWEYRVLIITSPTFENPQAKKQKGYFELEAEGLQDRKLKIYHITNEGYSVDFDAEILPRTTTENQIAGFNVSLIGLDGTSKYQATSPQKAALFFTLIDGMPMRKAAVKNKQD